MHKKHESIWWKQVWYVWIVHVSQNNNCTPKIIIKIYSNYAMIIKISIHAYADSDCCSSIIIRKKGSDMYPEFGNSPLFTTYMHVQKSKKKYTISVCKLLSLRHGDLYV